LRRRAERFVFTPPQEIVPVRPNLFGRFTFGLAAAGLFVLVSGCGRQGAPQAAVPEPTPVVAATAGMALAAEEAIRPRPSQEPKANVQKIEEKAEEEKAETARVAVEAPRTAAEQVQAHLAAGEFGAAVRIADAVESPAEREALLTEIADVEAEAGEFAAAGLIVSRFPQGLAQTARGVRAAAQELAGGGVIADFSQLMFLIQMTTAGPWEEVESVGGTMAPYNTGVYVDPLGLMGLLSKADQSNRLRDLASSSRVADLNADMAKASELRVVSLTRLERAVAEKLRRGEPVPTSMRHLAGLTRVQYLFLDETTGEILLAGPAEGWRYDETGAAVGAESGRPVLYLDDLVTLLRTFAPGGMEAFQCLIVPRQEGLKAVQEYAAASTARGPLRPGAGVRNFANRLGELLGEQDVVVNGVPLDSRVARTIVEADYRMKLIGIDRHQAAGLPSFFDLLNLEASGPVATKALRWWLTMNYDAVLHSHEKTAFEFLGQAVKCLSEDEFLTPEGERVPTGKAEAANKLFADQFTAGYEELAAEDLLFAELRNIFDLALAAALIRAEQLDARAGWDRGVFASGGAYEPARYAPVRTVETAINHRVYDGTEVVVQVAGGVSADLMSLLKDSSIYRTAIRAGEAVAAVKAASMPETRWWWDVSVRN
jgi:hypothetical protein